MGHRMRWLQGGFRLGSCGVHSGFSAPLSGFRALQTPRFIGAQVTELGAFIILIGKKGEEYGHGDMSVYTVRLAFSSMFGFGSLEC